MSMRSVFFILCLCLCGSLPVVAEDIPAEALLVLESREVMGIIQFPPCTSVRLNEKGKQQARATLNKLAMYEESKIIRAEGFCSPGKDRKETMQASMLRAKAVRDYLASNGINNVYITGFGINKYGNTEISIADRVEIAIYDKLIDIDDSAVFQTINSLAVE